jgi:hypothetical protein
MHNVAGGPRCRRGVVRGGSGPSRGRAPRVGSWRRRASQRRAARALGAAVAIARRAAESAETRDLCGAGCGDGPGVMPRPGSGVRHFISSFARIRRRQWYETRAHDAGAHSPSAHCSAPIARQAAGLRTLRVRDVVSANEKGRNVHHVVCRSNHQSTNLPSSLSHLVSPSSTPAAAYRHCS